MRRRLGQAALGLELGLVLGYDTGLLFVLRRLGPGFRFGLGLGPSVFLGRGLALELVRFGI